MKAIVPGLVLKQCLDDMAGLKEPFELSDDDDDDDEEETNSKGMAAKNKKASKTSDDPYAGTLRMKAGKLYYFDYSKAKNGGDPDPAESNELAAKLANAQADEAALKDKLQKITAETSKLLGEPTNEEAAKRLSEEEPALKGIVGQVEEARGLKANEERRKATGKAIRVMTGTCRKHALNRIVARLAPVPATHSDLSVSCTSQANGERGREFVMILLSPPRSGVKAKLP